MSMHCHNLTALDVTMIEKQKGIKQTYWSQPTGNKERRGSGAQSTGQVTLLMTDTYVLAVHLSCYQMQDPSKEKQTDKPMALSTLGKRVTTTERRVLSMSPSSWHTSKCLLPTLDGARM